MRVKKDKSSGDLAFDGLEDLEKLSENFTGFEDYMQEQDSLELELNFDDSTIKAWWEEVDDKSHKIIDKGA